MNSQNVFDSNPKSRPDVVRNAEETLRLIASLPAPQGLEDRMIEGLRSAPRQGRVLSWPGLVSSSRDWLRTAAAAAIAFVIVGGGWGVYSRVQPGSTTATVPRPAMGGGFSNAGAVRVPQTLPAPQAVRPAPVNQNSVDLDKANHEAAKPDETSATTNDHEKATTKSGQHKKLDAVKKSSAQPAPSVAR
jgi:hypothetical protein